MSVGAIRLGLLLIAIAGSYFGAAKLGLALAFVAPQVTAVWPPTGIALAALILFGLRTWPAVWIGAFLANATIAPLAVAAGIASGNTLEAVAGAWLLSHWGFRPSLERIRHVSSLGVAAIVSTTISATVGLTSLCVGGIQPWSAFARIWIVWCLGDAMSVLVVAPLLLVWSSWPPRHWPRDRIGEGLALLTGLGVALWLIFGTRVIPDASPLHYLMFPFVIVAALRFGQPGTTAVTALASAVAIWGTAAGVGPFGGEDVAQGVVQAQLFLAVIAVTGLILASAISERALGVRFRAADYAATQALAESASLGDGAPRVLRAVCQSLDWDFGALWLVTRDEQLLRCLETWHAPSRAFPEFEAATRGRAFACGVGLPGRVWVSGEPVWIPDVVVDANFPRAPIAASEGLHGAFAFPIRGGGGDVLGVIEFFSRELQEPDADLLARIAALGSQIGQFIDRKRAEDEREQLLVRERAARSEAELANRAKDEFLAMLGHELRNPLGAITNAASALDRIAGDGRGAAARGIIARQAAQLALLVDDLLDVARVQSGRVELQRESVDLGNLIGRCIETLAPAIHAPDRELRISTTSLIVDGDPMRLDQIITNLLSNALKYTRPGGHIWVSANRERDRAVLRVRDDGVGIAPDLLPRVFDLFVQADRSLDRSKGGLGLGLTLVKRLVELHGGKVSADSGGPDRGSEFVVELPLASAPDSHEAPIDRAMGATARRVLVIDDHEDARESLRLLLTTAGHSVLTARDGLEGLGKLRIWRPDVAIVDIGLPGLDGYALAQQTRSEPALNGVLLVALTGYGQADDRARAIEAGFQLHLVKPVSVAALGRVLDDVAVRREQG